MAQIPPILTGVVHGKTIELAQESGFADGQSVTVILQPFEAERLTPEDYIRRSAGAWSDDPEGVDEFVRLMRELRENDRPPIEP